MGRLEGNSDISSDVNSLSNIKRKRRVETTLQCALYVLKRKAAPDNGCAAGKVRSCMSPPDLNLRTHPETVR